MIASRISPSFAPVSTASRDIPRRSLATFNVLTSLTRLASAIAPPADRRSRIENGRSHFRSILNLRSSIFDPRSSIFYPRSSIFDVFRAARDLIPGKIHEHFRLGPTDPFDRLRRNERLSSRKPAAGLDYDGADGPVSVVDDEIVHVADFAVGGLDVIPPHIVNAAQ